jgi:nucleotide-binding universal stress UspA family protein
MMKILLPVDGSEGSLTAVRQVVRWIHGGLGARVVLGNVQEPASLYEVVVAHDAKVIAEVSDAAATHSLKAAQEMLRAAGVEFESEFATGDPAHMLIDICERVDCDMIVMGARGVGEAGEGGLGSVARSVVNSAQVPVTIVKLPQR